MLLSKTLIIFREVIAVRKIYKNYDKIEKCSSSINKTFVMMRTI